MNKPKLERNMRIYMGRVRGIPLTTIAHMEGICESRAYQIVAATEYQLAKGNPNYWEVYEKFRRN